MAILPSCPGLKVEILVNGEPLKEYDEIDDTPVPPITVTKYVEAKSGAEFTISYRFLNDSPPPEGSIDVACYFDGKLSVTHETSTAMLARNGGGTISSMSDQIGKTSIMRSFMFDELTIGMVSNSVNLKNQLQTMEMQVDIIEGKYNVTDETIVERIKELGQISVKFSLSTMVRRIYTNSLWPKDEDFIVFPKEALKTGAQSHRITLGNPTIEGLEVSPHFFRTHEWVRKGPFAIFNFKYRSMDSLRTLKTVPPLFPIEERPEEDLSITELQQLVKQLKRKHADCSDKTGNSVQPAGKINDMSDGRGVFVPGPLARKRRFGQDKRVIALD